MNESRRNGLPEMIALVGLDGTGKGYLAEYLQNEYGYLVLGASSVIRREVAARKELAQLPLDEATRRLKETLGSTFISDSAVAQFNTLRNRYKGLAFDGVRRLPEIENFKRLGGVVLLITADPADRFAQLAARGRADAPATIEDMLKRDAVQLHGDPTDKNSLNMQAIIDLADASVHNRYDTGFFTDTIDAISQYNNR